MRARNALVVLKRCLLAAALLAVTLAITVTPALGAEADPLGFCSARQAAAVGSTLATPEQARATALQFLADVKSPGPFADWKAGTLDAGTRADDPDGHAAVYVFSVRDRTGAYLGYLTVDAVVRPDAVLEFSRNPSPVFSTMGEASGALTASALTGSPKRQLYLGPLQYGLEVGTAISPVKKVVLTGTLSRAGAADPLQGMLLGASTDGGAAAASVQDGAALGSSHKVLGSVPDYNQFYYNYRSSEYNSGTRPAATGIYRSYPYLNAGTYASGCAPTAAADIIKYWAQHGYRRLYRGRSPKYGSRSGWRKTVNDLHIYFKTFASGGSGSSYPADMGPGMEAYAKQIGRYEFESTSIESFSFDDYRKEISAKRPVLLGFYSFAVYDPVHGRSFNYGNHAVTGIGYDYTPGYTSSQYMIIHDNWPGYPSDVYVQYWGSYASYSGRYMVAFQHVKRPANNSFTKSRTVSRASGHTHGTNKWATNQSGEPYLSSGGSSVWFKWKAPSSGPCVFRTTGSKFDTVLAAYRGTKVNHLTLLASNDDFGGLRTSEVQFNAVKGVTYRIRVEGYGSNTGSYTLSWSVLRSISGSIRTRTGTPVADTLMTSRGGVASTNASGTYSISGLATGTYKVQPAKTGYYFAPVSRSVKLSGSHRRALNFTAYLIALNDTFALATPITGLPGTATGTSTHTTKEAGEPSHAGNGGGASVWFNWQAPSSGWVTFNTNGTRFDTLLGVYTGTSVSALTTVAYNDDFRGRDQSTVAFYAVAGTTYRVALDGRSGRSGAFTLKWLPLHTVSGTARTPGGVGITGVTVGSSVGTASTNASGVWGVAGLFDGSYAFYPHRAGYAFAPAIRSATVHGADVAAMDFVGQANNAFAAAFPCTGTTGTVSGSTAGANKESGEKAHAGNAGGASVWFTWTAQVNGRVAFGTAGSAFNTVMAVYTGTSVSALATVAVNDDYRAPSVRAAALAFDAVAGSTYRIAVDGHKEGTAAVPVGDYRLNWAPVKKAALTRPTLSKATPKRKSTFTITGYVSPWCAGTVRVYLYRSVGGHLKAYPRAGRYATRTVTTAGTRAKYTYRLRLPAGSWAVRTYYAGGTFSTANWSPYRKFRVR